MKRQTVDYKSDNVILEEFTKEGNIEKAVGELMCLRDEMVRLHQEKE